MRYFAQVISSGDRKWDEVSEAVYNDLDSYLNMDETPRYNGNRFCHHDKGVEMHCPTSLSQTELAIITRLVGAEKSCPPSVPGGFVSRPDFLLRKKGKSKPVLLQVATGQTYKKS